MENIACEHCKKKPATNQCILRGPFFSPCGKMYLCQKCITQLHGIYNLECFTIGYLKSDAPS